MNENGKKIYVSVFLIIITLIIIGFCLVINNKRFSNSNVLEEKGTNDLAIIVFDDTVGRYIRQNEFPKGDGFFLNREKSKCASGNDIGNYDAVNGTVEFDFTTPDKCELYFDKNLPTLATYIKEDVYTGSNPNGTAGVYFHPSDTANANYLAGGAEDDSYRYAGGYNFPKEGYSDFWSIINEAGSEDELCDGRCYTLVYDETKTKYSKEDAWLKAVVDGYIEDEVNNYVCFEGDDCTDIDSLYRIIGVDSANQVKLIKAKGAKRFMEDFDRFFIDQHWNSSSYAMGYKLKAEDTALMNGTNLTSGTTLLNIWAYPNGDGTYYTSDLNSFLNGDYLNNILGDNAAKIIDTLWHVGGYTYDQMASSTPQAIYEIEKADSITYSAKIGLMYLSEYSFAALPEYWSQLLPRSSQGAVPSYGKNWMISQNDKWTISRQYDDHESQAHSVSNVFLVYSIGSIDRQGSPLGAGVYPTFSISSDVKIANPKAEGVGTINKPIIIS